LSTAFSRSNEAHSATRDALDIRLDQHQDQRETVFLRQSKSFCEAEEIARLTCEVKNTMSSPENGMMRRPSYPTGIAKASLVCTRRKDERNKQ